MGGGPPFFRRDFPYPGVLVSKRILRLRAARALWAALPGRSALSRFGLFPVRSPLLGESSFLSFLPVTEMFQFAGFPRARYVFTRAWQVLPAGFPHSDSRGSLATRASPRRFAACRVLRRLPVPGHPPRALFFLTISNFWYCTLLLSQRPIFFISWTCFYL